MERAKLAAILTIGGSEAMTKNEAIALANGSPIVR